MLSLQGEPTVVYEVVADHSRRILSATPGFPGTCNDKTTVKFDGFVENMRDKGLYSDVTFNLYNEDGAVVTGTGAYLICDGGYHRWRILQCGEKHSSTPAEVRLTVVSYLIKHASLHCTPFVHRFSLTRFSLHHFSLTHFVWQLDWSKWVWSARKDVECTFGILKGRFRILKTPMRYHNKSCVDNVFHTCCMLHNMILDCDGIRQNMLSSAVRAAREQDEELWDGMLGWHDATDDMTEIFTGRVSRIVHRQWDASGVEWRRLRPGEVETHVGWSSLRKALVTHFVHARRKGDVVWIG